MKEDNYFELEFLRENCGSFLINPYFDSGYISEYNKIYIMGKTAVEKFGKDIEPFKKTLSNFKPASYKNLIKKRILNLSTTNIERISYPDFSEYIYCLTAILQVDFECPGFMNNFPEAIRYVDLLKNSDTYILKKEFKEIYEKVIKTFNRYSKKSDFSHVKKLFTIPDSEDIRFDDYISLNFQKYWKTGDKEIKDYLKKYYVHSDVLLPEDYCTIMKYSQFNEDILDRILWEDTNLEWIDLYFKYQDEVVNSIHKEIDKTTPSFMRKVNLTLT